MAHEFVRANEESHWGNVATNLDVQELVGLFATLVISLWNTREISSHFLMLYDFELAVRSFPGLVEASWSCFSQRFSVGFWADTRINVTGTSKVCNIVDFIPKQWASGPLFWGTLEVQVDSLKTSIPGVQHAAADPSPGVLPGTLTQRVQEPIFRCTTADVGNPACQNFRKNASTVYICIYTYYVHTHMYIYIHVHIHVYVYIYIYIYTYIFV